MKNNISKYSILIFSICLISTKLFAQEPPPDPGVDPLDSCVYMDSTTEIVSLQQFPIYFKRNNDESVGIYGDDSQIRLNFNQQPAIPLIVTRLQSFSFTDNLSKADYRRLKNINAICSFRARTFKAGWKRKFRE